MRKRPGPIGDRGWTATEPTIDSRFLVGDISKTRVLCSALALGLLWGSTSQPARPDLDTCLASPQVRRQFQTAVLASINSAMPDPKREFAGLLPKTGFILRWQNGRARLEVLENPNVDFMNKLVLQHDRDDVAEGLLRVCGQEPQRTRKLASYTAERVLERLEADNRTHQLSAESRRAISRALIQELVANSSIDAGNQIRDTIAEYLARSADTQQNVLAYGFSLVEYDEPNQHEWQAMLADTRLVCFRAFRQGFTVYRVRDQQRFSRFYTVAGWPEKIGDALNLWESRHNTAGRAWMGIGEEQPDHQP